MAGRAANLRKHRNTQKNSHAEALGKKKNMSHEKLLKSFLKETIAVLYEIEIQGDKI